MDAYDETARRNQEQWEQNARDGDSNTIPWLELDVEAIRDFAKSKTDRLPEPYCHEPVNGIVMSQAAGKDVLCLASGGGQQSALFGLLGARVMVLDFCQGQLEGDRKAAAHYGYPVVTVQGDMRDLSRFADDSFDIVWQAVSIVFVPDVRQVYREVARVLRPGGLYFVAQVNPSVQPTCFDGPANGWDGIGYRIAEPYCGGPTRVRPDGSENMTEGEPTGEHRHLFSDIFNGLVECGLSIQGVWEASCHLRHDPTAQPGTDAHWRTIIAEYLNILARKQCDTATD